MFLSAKLAGLLSPGPETASPPRAGRIAYDRLAHELVLCAAEAAEPDWYARLRALPAFRELLHLGVEERLLLQIVAFARAGKGVCQLAANAGQLERAAQQARVLARELESLPIFDRAIGGAHNNKPELVYLMGMLGLAVADAALRAAGISGNAEALGAVGRVFDLAAPERPLAAALRESGYWLGRMANRLKQKSRRQPGKIYLARMLADLAEDRTGRPRYALCAALYAFVFARPPMDEYSFRLLAVRARRAAAS